MRYVDQLMEILAVVLALLLPLSGFFQHFFNCIKFLQKELKTKKMRKKRKMGETDFYDRVFEHRLGLFKDVHARTNGAFAGVDQIFCALKKLFRRVVTLKIESCPVFQTADKIELFILIVCYQNKATCDIFNSKFSSSSLKR